MDMMARDQRHPYSYIGTTVPYDNILSYSGDYNNLWWRGSVVRRGHIAKLGVLVHCLRLVGVGGRGRLLGGVGSRGDHGPGGRGRRDDPSLDVLSITGGVDQHSDSHADGDATGAEDEDKSDNNTDGYCSTIDFNI